jgi:hypothetical protein
VKDQAQHDHRSLLLYYTYAGLLNVSFLFMASSGMLGKGDHSALRVITTAACLYGVYCAGATRKWLWLGLLAAVVIVFNPVWHLDGLAREIWMMLDLAAAAIILSSFVGLRSKPA